MTIADIKFTDTFQKHEYAVCRFFLLAMKVDFFSSSFYMFVETSCLWQFISRLTQIRLYSQRYQFELRLKTSALYKKTESRQYVGSKITRPDEIAIEMAEDCHILQDDLNSLAKWETDWQIKFNVSKCHSMRVTRLHPSNHIQFSYTLHQQILEQVQSAKYLGLTITDNLDWGQHISEITCKATKTLGFLRRNSALAPRHTAYKGGCIQNIGSSSA